MRAWPTGRAVRRTLGEWERCGERVLTAADDVVDERVRALEEVMLSHGFPVVAVFGDLVFEEVHVGALVPALCCERLRNLAVRSSDNMSMAGQGQERKRGVVQGVDGGERSVCGFDFYPHKDESLLLLSEVISPILFGDFARRVCPSLERLSLYVVHFVQMLVCRAEDVC